MTPPRLAAIATAVVAVAVGVSAQAPCGNQYTGPQSCQAGSYCQPWNPSYYQCIEVPKGCSGIETNVDYYGGDIERMPTLLPRDCSAKCEAKAECKFFTFVNFGPHGPMCYLKSSDAGRRPMAGAVSGRIARCGSTGEWCGNEQVGPQCCQAGSYCQPWNPGYYQCISVPAQCGNLETDADYYGGDLISKRLPHPNDCCVECQKTPQCKFFTFANSAPGGSMCYLKSSNADRRRKVGVVSGQNLAQPKCSAVSETCGNAEGSWCCEAGAYCQPWDKYYYQCRAQPEGFEALETDTDYYGGDVAFHKGLSPDACVSRCRDLETCAFFTFINSLPDGVTQCYLKGPSAENGKTRKVGAVSGKKRVVPTPTPTTTQPSPSPTTPAPPINTTICAQHSTQIDYFGDELKSLKDVADPGACCDACAGQSKCGFFVWSNMRGARKCRLLREKGRESANYVGDPNRKLLAGTVLKIKP